MKDPVEILVVVFLMWVIFVVGMLTNAATDDSILNDCRNFKSTMINGKVLSCEIVGNVKRTP